MRRGWLLILAAFLMHGTLACNEQDSRLSVEATGSGSVTPAANCPAEQQAWTLDGKQWVEICYDNPIPKAALRWGSDGTVVVAIGGSQCKPYPEPLDMWVLRQGSWTHHTLEDVSSNELGSGGGLAVFDGKVFLIGGEPCDGFRHSRLKVVALDGEVIHHGTARDWRLWPGAMVVDGELLHAAGFSGPQDDGARIDIRDAPGTSVYGDNDCYLYATEGSFEDGSCSPEEAFTVELTDIDHNRGVFTWVYDPVNDRKVFLGHLADSGVAGVLSDSERVWTVSPGAYAVTRRGQVQELPKPPVIGDGVSLLWDRNEERVLLLDPYGKSSYLLNDDDQWESPVHDQMPPQLPEDLMSRTSASVNGIVFRMTQWVAPYFAYWDEERGQPVVVPYSSPDSLCMPVQEVPELFACPKAHP